MKRRVYWAIATLIILLGIGGVALLLQHPNESVPENNLWKSTQVLLTAPEIEQDVSVGADKS